MQAPGGSQVFERNGKAVAGLHVDDGFFEFRFGISDAVADADPFARDADDVGGEFAVFVLIVEDGDGVSACGDVFEFQNDGAGFGGCLGLVRGGFDDIRKAFVVRKKQCGDDAFVVADPGDSDGDFCSLHHACEENDCDQRPDHGGETLTKFQRDATRIGQ